MQTAPPIINARTAYLGLVHPARKKMAQVAISVAMLMPLIGLEELPSNPLMRPATVTNRNPKTTTNTAANRFWYHCVCAPWMGKKVSTAQIMATMTIDPPTTHRMGTSQSMRLEELDWLLLSARTSFSPARSAEMIVGIVRSRVISPEAATAPAPIGRM